MFSSMFCSIAGRLAQAGLCSVVLQDGWLVFSSIARQLVQVHGGQLYCRMSNVSWLVFSSIAGLLAQAGLCSVVQQDGWLRQACVQ